MLACDTIPPDESSVRGENMTEKQMLRKIETLERRIARLERHIEKIQQGNGRTTRKPIIPSSSAPDPLEKFIGAFDSRVPDWTERHDIYLGKNLRQELKSPKASKRHNA